MIDFMKHISLKIDNIDMIDSMKHGSGGGFIALAIALVQINFSEWLEPILLGLLVTMLTTTLSFFWKKLLRKIFPSKEVDNPEK